MVYLSIFTGLIFTFSIYLAHINASNNTQPLCKKHMDKKITQALPSSSLHSKGCVKGRCLEIQQLRFVAQLRQTSKPVQYLSY